jgi:hypothetical protein
MKTKFYGLIVISLLLFSCKEEVQIVGEEQNVEESSTLIPQRQVADGDCTPRQLTMDDYVKYGDRMFLLRIRSVEAFPLERSVLKTNCSTISAPERDLCLRLNPSVYIKGDVIDVIDNIVEGGLGEDRDAGFVIDANVLNESYDSHMVYRDDATVEWSNENHFQAGQVIGFIAKLLDSSGDYIMIGGTEFQMIDGEILWSEHGTCGGSAEWQDIRNIEELKRATRAAFERAPARAPNEVDAVLRRVNALCWIHRDVCDSTP